MEDTSEMKSPYYILVYNIEDYPESGGGTYYEKFEYARGDESIMVNKPDAMLLDDRVEELSTKYGNKFRVLVAGWLHTEYEFKPARYIVKYERVDKK